MLKWLAYVPSSDVPVIRSGIIYVKVRENRKTNRRRAIGEALLSEGRQRRRWKISRPDFIDWHAAVSSKKFGTSAVQ